MQRQWAWQPAYWSGGEYMQREVERLFPTAIFHENSQAARGRPPVAGSPWQLPPLDESFLSGLRHAESNALGMMDRMDPDGSFDFHERRELYHLHTQIALVVLERLQPNLVVFSTMPHLVYDYVLYEVCRLRNVPTLVFFETAVDGLVLSAPTIEEATRKLNAAYISICALKREAALSATAESYCRQMEGDYSQAVPQYVVGLLSDERVKRPRTRPEHDIAWRIVAHINRFFQPSLTQASSAFHWGGSSRIGRFFAPFVRLVVAIECTIYLYRAIANAYSVELLSINKVPGNYFKQHGIPLTESELSNLEYWLYRLLALRKKRLLLDRYRQMGQTVNVSQPYVYVALHYQPEASTSPLGGVFVDQYLMVEMLSKCVPDGWLVVVRENPFQLKRRSSGDLARPLNFYHRLAKLPNVRLASLDASPFSFIDGAKAVATVTGTSGWEAVMRGVPVLAFGRAWYLGCEGVFPAARLDERARRLGVHQVQRFGRKDNGRRTRVAREHLGEHARERGGPRAIGGLIERRQRQRPPQHLAQPLGLTVADQPWRINQLSTVSAGDAAARPGSRASLSGAAIRSTDRRSVQSSASHSRTPASR
jgi:hypothetical protein